MSFRGTPRGRGGSFGGGRGGFGGRGGKSITFSVAIGKQVGDLMCAQAEGVLPNHMDPQQLS